MKVRRLLTTVKKVAQKTTRCLEAMKSSEWRADDGTHLFPGLNQSGCRNRGAARRARQVTHTHTSREQSRWAESSTEVENPRVRSFRARLAQAPRARHLRARIVKRGGHLRRHRLHGKRAGPGSLESRPVQAKVTYQYQEPRQQLRPSWSASAPSPSWTALWTS